ncbi:hypothetical protein MKX03_014096, partial [Papaver bracteatum]
MNIDPMTPAKTRVNHMKCKCVILEKINKKICWLFEKESGLGSQSGSMDTFERSTVRVRKRDSVMGNLNSHGGSDI